jgi:hypothetical protein
MKINMKKRQVALFLEAGLKPVNELYQPPVDGDSIS